MRPGARKRRLIALLAPATALAALIVTGAATAPVSLAIIPTYPASVTCLEFFLDVENNGQADNGTDPEDVAALALSRIEPLGGDEFALTSVLYLGADTEADEEILIPDQPPDQDCAGARAEALAGAEVSSFSQRLELVSQFDTRPRPYPLLLFTKYYAVRGCVFDETLGAWVRIDYFVTLEGTGPTSVNDEVDAVLYLGTGEPGLTVPGNPHMAQDPWMCSTFGAIFYHSVARSYGRDVRTDDPSLPQNVAFGVAADPSGTTGPDTADGLQDDYDGDGCTDWDELDRNFDYDYTAPNSAVQRGMDPFNPNDCDASVSTNVSLLVMEERAYNSCAWQTIVDGTCISSGSYLHCVGLADHTQAGASQPVDMELACYPDSSVGVVNVGYTGGETGCSPAGTAPAQHCGDGRAGTPPPSPGRFIAPGTGRWPLTFSGAYDTATGQLAIGGCFGPVRLAGLGPEIYGAGVIDLRTGAGTMDLWDGLTEAQCSDPGAPGNLGAPAAQDVETDLVEIGAAGVQRDSDLDGCPDAVELGDDEEAGGLRDPLNPGDWFDTDGNGTVDLFFDILEVAALFGATAPGPPYDAAYDRSGQVPGGEVWNITPANGIIDLFEDIFGAAYQFGHTCAP